MARGYTYRLLGAVAEDGHDRLGLVIRGWKPSAFVL